MQTDNQTERTPPIRSTGLVRVRAEWRDCDAGIVYQLQRYKPRIRFILLIEPGGWETITMFTRDIEKAKKWAEHYGCEIEYEPGLKHSNDQAQ
jgi:hypothetical protein